MECPNGSIATLLEMSRRACLNSSVNFVTSSYKPELLKPLVEKISMISEVVSIMNNVNTSVGNTSVGEEEYNLYGKSTITEILRGLTFQISANSFFLTNTRQVGPQGLSAIVPNESMRRLFISKHTSEGDGTKNVFVFVTAPHFSLPYIRVRNPSCLAPSFFPNKMENGLKPMDAEQLRENAHKMVDFIADYYKNIEDFPVLSQVQPGYLRGLLPESAPNCPDSLQDVLDDVRQKILPGVTHWQSPDYFAYFPSNSSTAGFLGEMLSAGFNIVGFSWITSPAATELEMIVLDWLAKLLKLPEQFLSVGQGGGVIQGTASEAVLVVLLAARDKVLRRIGKNFVGKLVVYSSDQAHASLQKACQITGIHPENFRLIKADATTNYAVDPDVVSKAVSDDFAGGLIPFFLCATVGTTSSTAVDPLSSLGKIAKDNNLWFHIDAAYAGSACICPEYRHFINGVEEADSFNMNAHKWFLTNFDCSALWVKDRSALVQSLSTNPEYLRNKASQANTVVDYKDWQIPLGRRFRSLKLWMVLRLYGVENLQSYIRNHIKLAELFEKFVAADPRFEVVVPRAFSLVCFRLLPTPHDQDNGYRLNYNLLEAVNSSGKIFISHTVLSGKYILRFAVGAPLTEERHVKGAWEVLQEHATNLLGGS